MLCVSDDRCIIGEGPIWNEKEKLLYFVNPREMEIRTVDLKTKELKKHKCPIKVSAIAFDEDYNLIISTPKGVFRLIDFSRLENIYDTNKYRFENCNDMKVGPDGRVYVGTQSSARLGNSENVDGKLYSIDKNGEVNILLDNLRLSNGLEWSIDGKKLYHTDSDTGIIKEYHFENNCRELKYTQRYIKVPGVDGFTINKKDRLYVGCWGQGHIAVVDTENMIIENYIDVPAKIPTSCGFAGDNMEYLAVVTANYDCDLTKDKCAGYTFIHRCDVGGRAPFLFGKSVC